MAVIKTQLEYAALEIGIQIINRHSVQIQLEESQEKIQTLQALLNSYTDKEDQEAATTD